MINVAPYNPGQIGYPTLAQPKLDGIRCTIEIELTGPRGRIVAITKGGSKISSRLAHLNKGLRALMRGLGLTRATLDGELLHVDGTWASTVSIVNSKRSIADRQLTLHAFDLRTDAELPYRERMHRLAAGLRMIDTDYIVLVPTEEIHGAEELEAYYRASLSDAEGIVIKHSEFGPWMKRKAVESVSGTVTEIDPGYMDVRLFDTDGGDLVDCRRTKPSLSDRVAIGDKVELVIIRGTLTYMRKLAAY